MEMVMEVYSTPACLIASYKVCNSDRNANMNKNGEWHTVVISMWNAEKVRSNGPLSLRVNSLPSHEIKY